MAKIEIFEPELTCIGGVCTMGDDVDRTRMEQMVASFADDGWDITRYNLTMAPMAFQENAAIAALIAKRGTKVLPVTVVDGKIVKLYEYPTALEFVKWFQGEEA